LKNGSFLLFLEGEKGGSEKRINPGAMEAFLFLGPVWGRKKEGSFFITTVFYWVFMAERARFEPAIGYPKSNHLTPFYIPDRKLLTILPESAEQYHTN